VREALIAMRDHHDGRARLEIEHRLGEPESVTLGLCIGRSLLYRAGGR
jgi:hypothetical protein